MKECGQTVVWVLLVVSAAAACGATRTTRDLDAPLNFIYFGLDRSRISDPEFLGTEAIVGAQLKYRWKELERERDRYDLRPILEDLAFLESHGKKLFVQLQDVSFDGTIINVPDYLLSDPGFGGGVARQYSFEGGDESSPIPEGWVARRWDPAVRDRLVELIRALGRELDGRIEGLNLAETAVDFGERSDLRPAGFTPEAYYESVKILMTETRHAFVRSHPIVYANFMPGEALPEADHGYLRGVYDHADRIGMGVGGPDLLPHRRGQQLHSYPLIAARNPNTFAGVAVQWGNLEDKDPATGKRVTVDEVYGFARDGLRLNYIFWGTQEPYYSTEILPYLRDLSGADGS